MATVEPLLDGARTSRQVAAEVGAPIVPFELPAAAADGSVGRLRVPHPAGQWLVLLFYPTHGEGACASELRAFSAACHEFEARDARLVGIGVGSIEEHRRWVETPIERGGLGPLRFPLATDVFGSVARWYGVRAEPGGSAGRGVFIVEPGGVLEYAAVQTARICRRPEETLRVLRGLQKQERCRPGWILGDGTLDPGQRLGRGRLLGRYRILGELGEGGFGQVFDAWDLWLERKVAIKVARAGRTQDLERMVAEARPAAGLLHPNICTTFAVEVHEGLPVIAMESLRGRSLASRLRRGPLAVHHAKAVLRQVAAGMEAAHARAVVHGDLKPGNVMLCDDGVVKVLDFGLGHAAMRWPGAPDYAPSSSAPRRGDLPCQGGCNGEPIAAAEIGLHACPCAEPGAAAPRGRLLFRGTPQYMSPEHGRATPIDAASDVFSFGLVVYESLTGKKAIGTRKLEEAIRIVRHVDLRGLADELPQPFRGLVRACLVRETDDRPTMASIHLVLSGGC